MRCCKWLILCVLVGWSSVLHGSPDTLRIVSYNVENLFDNRHDTLKSDLDYMPEGARHWTYRRYQAKVERIAQVLTAIGGWHAPILVGLCEVENARCLRSLCWCLRRYHYKYVHYESPDERGIDVALLYDSTRFHLLHSEPIPVPLPSAPTRDILFPIPNPSLPITLTTPHSTFPIRFIYLSATFPHSWAALPRRHGNALSPSPSSNPVLTPSSPPLLPPTSSSWAT